jgi:hypothetical protein
MEIIGYLDYGCSYKKITIIETGCTPLTLTPPFFITVYIKKTNLTKKLKKKIKNLKKKKKKKKKRVTSSI